MARVKGAMMTRKRRNKTLKLAKGYWGAKSKHFKVVNRAVDEVRQLAYAGRKKEEKRFQTALDNKNQRRMQNEWNQLFTVHERA